jgi:hypothetical protein
MDTLLLCSETLQQDILRHVFQFIDISKDIPTLMAISQTCHIFRVLSSTERDTHLTRIIAGKKATRAKEKQIARYNFFDKATALVGVGSAIVYPASVGTCFAVGLIYLSIIAPLLFDGVIVPTVYNYWLVSIPLWFLLVLPILFSALHFLLVEILRHMAPRCVAIDDTSIFYEHDILNMYPISLGLVTWIPMIFICVYARILVGKTNTSFRVSFVPLHIVTAMFILLPLPVLLYYSRRKRQRQFTSWITYFASAFVNTFVSLQLGLISGKLDQAIETYWLVIFIPTFVLLLILMSSLFVYLAILAPIMSCKYKWHDHWYSTPHVLIGTAVAVLPFLLSVLMLTLRMDLFLTVPYAYCFIPLYVGPGLIPVIGVLVLGIICLNICIRCDCGE